MGGVVKWGSGGKLGKIAGEGQLGRAGEIDVLAVQIDAEQAAVRLHLRAAAADKAEPGQRRDGRARSGAAGEREVLDAALERQQADPVFPGHGTEVDVGPAREGGAAAQARGQLTQLGARTVQLRQHNGVRDARLAQLQIGAALIRGLRVHSDTTIECLDDDCGFFPADSSDDENFLFFEARTAKDSGDPESDVTHIGRIVIDNVILKGTAARPDQIMIGSRVDSLSINSVSAGDVRKGELIERRGNWEVDSLTIR